jgi:hypothetical protein
MQILRALAESRSARGNAKLLEVARSGDDLTMRAWAIRYLGELKDPASFDALVQIYDAEKSLEIRSQLLRALAESEDPRGRAKILEIARKGETPELRMEAIRRLGDRGKIAMDDLLSCTVRNNLRLSSGCFEHSATWMMHDKRNSWKSCVNRADRARGYAIRHRHDDPETVNQLVGLYDMNKPAGPRCIVASGDSNRKARCLADANREERSVS